MFKIQNRKIGDAYQPFVIAEIGINHEGKPLYIDNLFKLVTGPIKRPNPTSVSLISHYHL
jgi:hypothetical protein